MSKRRGNNEGSITKRSDGRWMGRYTVEGKQKTLYGKTKTEVREKLTRAQADRDAGMHFDSKNQTAASYLRYWLTDVVRGTVAESTFRSYKQVVENYLVPGIGRDKLASLRPHHLQKLYREMEQRGLSPRTIGYTHTIIKKALKDAKRGEYVPRNVAEDVDPPKVQRDEMHPLNGEQVRALLETARGCGSRLEALFTVAVHTGMRPGELLALRWDDADLEAGTLTVARSLSNKTGEFTAPKTGKGRRIQLSQSATEALRSHRKMALEERLQAGGRWADYGLVFPSTVGTPMSHRNVSRAFKDLLREADLPDVRLYDLRHTCATLLLSANVHPKYVAEQLGHASITLTLDTYSHLIPGMDGGTGPAMDEALG